MTRRVLAVAVLACVAVVGAACSDDDSSSSSGTTTTVAQGAACEGCPVFGESDTMIEVASGDEFVIELEANPTTGYEWTATSSDEAIVREESTEYVKPSTDALGAPGTQRFVLSAGDSGSATLTLRSARSFEADDPTAREVTYSVTVA